MKDIWLVVRKYGFDGGDSIRGFTNEAEAYAMRDKLTELLGSYWDEWIDPPYDENGQPIDTAFKQFVRENFLEDEEAYELLMTSAEMFHPTEFEVKKVQTRFS